MKKMMVWAMVVGCFVLTAGAANAVAKKSDLAECKVESVEGTKVVLNCTTVGKEITAGAVVSMKIAKVKAAAEKPAATEPAKPAEAAKPAEPAKPAAAPAPAKAAEPAAPAAPAKPAPKKKIEGC